MSPRAVPPIAMPASSNSSRTIASAPDARVGMMRCRNDGDELVTAMPRASHGQRPDTSPRKRWRYDSMSDFSPLAVLPFDMGVIARTDVELVEASLRGEHAAFGDLVARYQDVVCAVSYSSTGDRGL